MRSRTWTEIINKFSGGTNTLLSEARIDKSFAKESKNLIQVEDGLWKKRWGTASYGQAVSGESSLLGVAEYMKSDGTRELICIGGTTGKVFKSTDGGSWTEVTGATFTIGHEVRFEQINDVLYMFNNVDNLV